MSIPVQLKNLSPDRLNELKHHFRNAPAATKLAEYFLACKKETYHIPEAVKHVYGEATDDSHYRLLENRFYKLRKKIEDFLNNNPTADTSVLNLEEASMLEAKKLLTEGKFIRAEKLLKETHKNCQAKNLFEIRPEVIDMLIQARQALNKIDETASLHLKFAEALVLYIDVMEAKNLTRQIYEVNFKQGTQAAEPMFLRMAKLDRKHPEYPRFKLIYNFVAGYYKVGSGDNRYRNQTNVTNRHIQVAKKIMQQHPHMPVVQHTAVGQAQQHYMLIELQAMVYYNAMRFTEAADEITYLYSMVAKASVAMSRQKNEVLFTNCMRMFVAAGRFTSALEAARDYLKFLVDNQRYEQNSYAYTEIANIHVSMFPQPSGYDVDFLLDHVNGYMNLQAGEKEPRMHTQVLLLKIKMFITLSKCDEALEMLDSIDAKHLTGTEHVKHTLKRLIIIASQKQGMNISELQLLKKESRNMKVKANTSGEYLLWRWVEQMSSYFLSS